MKRQKDMTLKDELPRLVGAQFATAEEWRNNSRKNEEMDPKQKQCPIEDVTGDGSKRLCYKDPPCIGTWNVRSMNQKELAVVKQEMARRNINILGVRELKWTGMCEFNSDDPIYYYGHKSFRRNGVVLIVNKRVQSTVLGCSLKDDKMISVHFQGKPLNITVIKSMPQPVMLKTMKLNSSMKTYKTFYYQHPKYILFIRGDWNAKVGGQEIPG